MKLIKAAAIIALGLAVSGCASTDVATRNAPYAAPKASAETLGQLIDVEDVTVKVSRDLRVSEAELFYPVADLVWRGEPRGDRYQQVANIFATSASAATQDLNVGPRAKVEIDVTRFHSLTDKARYTVGGVHSINFVMRVRDPETGIDLIAPRKIKADLKGYGGQAAIAADARGETQKKRITQHLANVIRAELTGGIAPVAQAAPSVSRNQTAPAEVSFKPSSGIY